MLNQRIPSARVPLAAALLVTALASCATAAPRPLVRSAAAQARFDLPSLPAPQAISRQEYAARRAALAQSMQDGVFVAFGSAEPELDYLPYAQNASFRYLTGVTEPDAGLIMVKRGGNLEETLFVRPRNPAREVWEGARLGVEGASSLTGMRARPAEEFIPALSSLVGTLGTLHAFAQLPTAADAGATLTREQQLLRHVVQQHPQARVVSLTEAVERLRARKSAAELDLIRRAVLVSTLAHREAMRSTLPGMNEFEIHALVEYYFRRSGAEGPAYSSIVGSGPNSTTLHYRSADRFMNDGEVLLMDVGASYRGYAADITRTIPINGRFTPEQRSIYDIVLEAQKAAESRVRVGAAWSDLNAAANAVIAAELARLGLIDAADATYDCQQPQSGNRCRQFNLFYMHGLGHGVGLNVHDPDQSYFSSFDVGSAFTIEPGIYVREDALDFLMGTPENRAMIERLRPALQRYRNIGVRIEDVYLITASGVERPSEGIPREPAEVEALMAQRGVGEEDRRPQVIEWYRATTPR